jgi:hypothetical protein
MVYVGPPLLANPEVESSGSTLSPFLAEPVLVNPHGCRRNVVGEVVRRIAAISASAGRQNRVFDTGGSKDHAAKPLRARRSKLGLRRWKTRAKRESDRGGA